jgi:uncharacterized membrane protein
MMKINNKSLQILVAIVCLMVSLLPVSIKAEGTPGLSVTLLPSEEYHEIIAGREEKLLLEVKNTGTESLTDIRLSAITPEEIVILIEPDIIELLEAGSLQQVEVTIKPGEKIESGEYLIAFMAEANEAQKAEAIWIKVKSSSFWLWVSGAAALVVVIGCVVLYLRYARKTSLSE